MSISPISKPTSLNMITLVMIRLVLMLMTGISSFKCSDPFWTRNTKYQVPGFRIVTHFTRIVARTWEWLGTVTSRWRSLPEELSGRILQQKLSKNFQKNFKKTFRGTFRRTFRQNLAAEQIFLPKNVQMFLKVFRPTEDYVEAFEDDKVDDLYDFWYFWGTFRTSKPYSPTQKTMLRHLKVMRLVMATPPWCCCCFAFACSSSSLSCS